jgi:hypothetical protein
MKNKIFVLLLVIFVAITSCNERQPINVLDPSSSPRQTTLISGVLASDGTNSLQAARLLDAQTGTSDASSWENSVNAWNASAYPMTAILDLRGAHALSKLEYFVGNLISTAEIEFYISTQTTPSGWQPLAVVNTGHVWNTWRNLSLNAPGARFLKLQFSSPAKRFNISELRLYEDSGSSTTPPVTPPTTPPVTPPTTQTGLPPSNLVRSRAYGVWTPSQYDTCPKELHDTYWALGPDGKVYPTWHPPTDMFAGKECTYGHEHGRDPKGSALYTQIGAIPFGYANEVLADSVRAQESNPDIALARERREDHVGHKIEWEHYEASDVNSVGPDSGRIKPTGVMCDFLAKLHQGTHSRDAFTNNTHEMALHFSCSNGGKFDLTLLSPLGKPGEFLNNCTLKPVMPGGSLNPTDAPSTAADGSNGNGERTIPCSSGALYNNTFEGTKGGTLGPQYFGSLFEGWTVSNAIPLPGGGSLSFGPYFDAYNPARLHDHTAPDMMAHTIDYCYRTNTTRSNTQACDAVRGLGQTIAWDDPRSPFNGTDRNVSPKGFLLFNDSGKSTTFYTDAYGQRSSNQAFAGSIKQFAATVKASVEGTMYGAIPNGDGTFKAGGFGNQFRRNYNAKGVHAPN